MKYEDYKITEGMLADKGVISLPDTPAENTPAELKAKFDELSREVIIPQFNTLMDLLDAGTTEEGEALGEIEIKIDNNTANIEGLENSKQDKLTAVGPLSIEVNEEEGTTEIKVDLSDFVTKDDFSDTASKTWVEEQGYAKDSDIPEWAKAEEKPTYTAEEVGALPSNTPIPTELSDLESDETHRVVTDNDISNWNSKASKTSVDELAAIVGSANDLLEGV